MRVRLAIVPVVLMATSLVACSSSKSGSGSTTSSGAGSSSTTTSSSSTTTSSSSSTSGGGSAAAFCTDLKSLGQKMNEITSKAGNPSDLKAVLATEGQYLAKLKADAPSELAGTIGDLETLFQEAQGALSSTVPDMTKLAGLATKLPADAQKLEQYAVANCK